LRALRQDLLFEKLVESEKAGYVSVSDAVKDSVRELLRKHKLLP
jgi:Arc/MetJ-type ribon-helix-helix transcriptional regulator